MQHDHARPMKITLTDLIGKYTLPPKYVSRVIVSTRVVLPNYVRRSIVGSLPQSKRSKGHPRVSIGDLCTTSSPPTILHAPHRQHGDTYVC